MLASLRLLCRSTRVNGPASRLLPLAAKAQHLLQDDEHRTYGDEGIGQVENREGPNRRVKVDVIDDIAAKRPIYQVSDRAAEDQGKTQSRIDVARMSAEREHCDEYDDAEHQQAQPETADAGKEGEGNAGVPGMQQGQE